MILEIKVCSNGRCGQTFKVWDKEKKEKYFCSEACYVTVHGANSFWGKEDRRATLLKEKRKREERYSEETYH